MPLTLHLDQARWREHLRTTWDPAIVPVVKGNGYGFGREWLLDQAVAFGATTVAVGTYDELPAKPETDVVVLTPWRPYLDAPTPSGGDPRTPANRVIHTVSRLADLVTIAPRSRVLVEVQTSMRRHGIGVGELRYVAANGVLDRIKFEGWSIHLPMGPGGTAANFAEAHDLCNAANAVRPAPVWVSHVPATKLADIGEAVRLRVGTNLWLGDRGALKVLATVNDVHRVRRGERVGYRQRRVPGDGHVLIVSGGTANGVGLEAPTAAVTVRQRAVSFAKGSLDAAGMALSPFTVSGKQRWFVEPPHMQASMLFLPSSVSPPAIGDEIPVDVRFTTTTFDKIVMD